MIKILFWLSLASFVSVLSVGNVVDLQDSEIVFKYEDLGSDYLQELRTKFDLTSLASNSGTELDKVLAVVNWVHNLWEHDSCAVPEKSDAISILTEVIEQNKKFRCVEYSTVICACLRSLGIHSRVVGLMTKDVETREYGAGHVVNEVFLQSLNKWVLVDGQANIIPVLNGVPLNLIELQKAISLGDKIDLISLTPCVTVEEYASYIFSYLCFFQTDLQPSDSCKKKSKSVILGSAGLDCPKVFQKNLPITNVVYTTSSKAFYANPIT